ncbi:MAG: antibiotic biosynthesis monooxygenase [Pirellulaceae bacterium]
MTDSRQALVQGCFAVIFTSQRTSRGEAEYAATAERMEQLAARQPGYLGVESVRGADGRGITISYWNSLDAVEAWRTHAEHLLAQQSGKEQWYQSFALHVCRVERSRTWRREN